jgi:hypothetical protein
MRHGLAVMLAAVVLSACGGSSAPSSTPAPATETDGLFRLELAVPHLAWRAGDAITGTATLSFTGPAPTTIYGPAGGVIYFSYVEVGGTRRVDPVWDAACASLPLGPAAPIAAALSKGGGITGSEPDADFLRSFLLTDPGVIRLPAGAWDISAVTVFLDGDACSGSSHQMRATVRVTVSG